MVRVAGHDGEPIDPANGPIWRAMVDAIATRGFGVETTAIGAAPRLDGLLSMNHRPAVLAEADAHGVPVRRRTLVLFEPQVTDPVAHAPATLQRYGRVLAPSPDWPHTDPDCLFPWPQSRMPEHADPLEAWDRRHQAALITQWNKFSAISGERYSLRRRVIACAQARGVPLDLTGPEWDASPRRSLRTWIHSAQATRAAGLRPDLHGLACLRPPLQRYLGGIDDKLAFTRRYRVAVCIENSGDYVSEKLFDAIRAQTLPVFVGPEAQLPDALQRARITTAPDPDAVVDRVEVRLALSRAEQHARSMELLEATRRSDAARDPLAVYTMIARTATEGWDAG